MTITNDMFKFNHFFVASILLLLLSISILTSSSSSSTSSLFFVSAVTGVCTGDEAYWIPDGRDYRGKEAVTRSGIPCQAWSAQTPHRHATLMDGSIGLGSHNYCRNPTPETMSSPWCFTMSPEVLFEQCNVGLPCTDGTDGQTTQPVTFLPIPGSTNDGNQNQLPHLISPAVITLSTVTYNASIYYSFDNSLDPSVGDAKLYDPVKKVIVVGSGFITIRAFAVRPGFKASTISTATYSLLPPSLPEVRIFPDPSRIDNTQPVLVSLSIDLSSVAAGSNGTGDNNGGLEIRYRIVESSLFDDQTVITQTNSNVYSSSTPFWVRTTSTVIAATFIPASTNTHILTGDSSNALQSIPTAAPSPMDRAYFLLNIPKADVPVVLPTPTSPNTALEGYGRVVFILAAPKIQSPTFEVCLNFSSFFDGAPESRCKSLVVASSGSTSNAFHLTTLGTTNVAFRVYGPTSAPSDFINITAIVRPMPIVRLTVPATASFIGPVDISATCIIPTFTFLLNNEVRIPPVVLSAQGTYNIVAYSRTIFDQGPSATSVVHIEAANLPKPVFSPLPEADVPTSSNGGPFVFASPLQVKLRPLSYLGGHAYFKIDVFRVDSVTGSRTRVPQQSSDRAPSNVTTVLTFIGDASSAANNQQAIISTFAVVATTICNDDGSEDCSLINSSVTSEAMYNVASPFTAASSTFSTPIFLASRFDGLSASDVTPQRVLDALFTTASTTSSNGGSMTVSVINSGSNVFLQLLNLSPRLAVQYTNWLAQDISSSSTTLRSYALQLRLGFAASTLQSSSSTSKAQISSTITNVGCLSSTALSSSLATTHFEQQQQFTVEVCAAYCTSTFPSLSSVIAVLSPPNRCDCMETASLGFQPNSNINDETVATVVMSNANFVSDLSLCNNVCSPGGKLTCGGVVADPAQYGLWSSTVCSAYLAFQQSADLDSTIVAPYPIATSWQLLKSDGTSATDSSQKYYSTTTSVLTMKFTFNNPVSLSSVNGNGNEGLVVLVRKTATSDCSTDAAELIFSNTQSYAAATDSYAEQLLLGYTSTFSYATGVTTKDMVVPTIGDYRVCVSFPQQGLFGDNRTFVEVSNSNFDSSVSSDNNYLHVLPGQYYPVTVSPRPGTYFAQNSMIINVSTTSVDAYLKITIDSNDANPANSKIYNNSWALVTISGAGKHTIIATAVSPKGDFHGSPSLAEYVLVPQVTINPDVAASYLASARYSFTTTAAGTLRVSLDQYGTVRVGSCDGCRVQLLPFGSRCSSLNSGDSSQQSTLGPYAFGSFTRTVGTSAPNGGGDGEALQSLSYISSEMMLSAPITQDPIVVCVGGAPWYQILPTDTALTSQPQQVLSVASAGIGFCQSAARDKMCQQNGGLCTHVSFSGLDEYGCFCPDMAVKRWNTFFCVNSSRLPAVWNGSIFDVNSVAAGGNNGGGSSGNNGSSDGKGSWGAFWALVLIYVVALAALWYHKTYRTELPKEISESHEMHRSTVVNVHDEK